MGQHRIGADGGMWRPMLLDGADGRTSTRRIAVQRREISGTLNSSQRMPLFSPANPPKVVRWFETVPSTPTTGWRTVQSPHRGGRRSVQSRGQADTRREDCDVALKGHPRGMRAC
jgi:hypothetical protein